MPLGLTQCGGSYQLRIVIPKDVRALYGDRTDFRISLGKLDKALAYPLAIGYAPKRIGVRSAAP